LKEIIVNDQLSPTARKAKQALSMNEKDVSIAVHAVGSILQTYLQERLRLPSINIRSDGLIDFLQAEGISQELVKEVMEIFQWSEMGRFGVMQMNLDENHAMVVRTDALIDQIEMELEKRG